MGAREEVELPVARAEFEPRIGQGGGDAELAGKLALLAVELEEDLPDDEIAARRRAGLSETLRGIAARLG